MQNLSQALENLRTTLTQQERQQPIQPPSSTSSGGALTTMQPLQSLPEEDEFITTNLGNRLKRSELKPLHSGGTKASLPALKQDEEGVKAVAAEIYQRFHAMKTWGKDPESLEAVMNTLLRDLRDYPAAEIIEAFSIHARRNPDFPQSCDLISILERDGAPTFDRAVFTAISRKQPVERTSSDWAYLEDYSEFAKTGDYQ